MRLLAASRLLDSACDESRNVAFSCVQQRALVARHLERKLQARQALILARQFVLQTPNLVGLAAGLARLDVEKAFELVFRGAALAQFMLRFAQRDFDALGALPHFAIFPQQPISRFRDEVAFLDRRRMARAQPFMRVFQESELDFHFMQARLGRLEFRQQFRHRRQQAVE